MASYTTEDIRNIALVGHGGSGKTTLVETLMHRAGAIHQPGSIERGTTCSDFDAQEKKYLHSLDSAIVSMDYHGGHINLIDTPGYPDFIGRTLPVLSAVETCAVVVNAQNGIENISDRMMTVARERRLDRLIIINKIDIEQADLAALLAQIQEQFGSECLPLNLPAAGGREVVDCFFQNSGPATDFSSVDEAHTNIIDQVVELDEALMELYLEQGEDISPAQLHEPFEKALREGHLVPVCFVSASSGAGIDELLEIFARLMPNPMEGNPPAFFKGEGEQEKPLSISSKADDHVLAHVFKISIDAFIGKLAVFRIHQGSITANSQLYIGDARKPFKLAHLFKLQGKEHREAVKGIPGDICATAKVEDLHFDAVLHDAQDEDHIHLRTVAMPPPMYGLAIAALSRGDEQKISDALHKLAAEDQSFIVEHRASLNETVIRGLGELHLRMMLEKLQERYHVAVETRVPGIAYRETICGTAEGHYRHKKQTGGAGQFAEVYLTVEALGRGQGIEFVDKVVGGVIPKQFIPAVEKGVRQACEEGVIAGFKVQDVRITVHDGKYHAVDSKEIAFIVAGKKAFLQAFGQAQAVILEPVVEISVNAQNEHMGDIAGDLAGKRGRIVDTRALSGGRSTVSALVPLSELDNYQSQLKSMTAGIGSYSLSFSHYDAVPAKVQQALVQACNRQMDDS